MARSPKQEKAERLDNSELLDLHCWSEHKEIKETVSLVYADVKKLKGFTGQDKVQMKLIRLIILNLYLVWLEDPAKYISFSRNHNDYNAKSRYNKLRISKLLPKMVDYLMERGFVEGEKGFYGIEHSRVSRMRSTKKLIRLFTKQGFEPEMLDLHPNKECIILRDLDEHGKKKDIEYEDTEATIQMRKDLYAYNNLLRRTFIDIPFYPPTGIPLKKRRPTSKQRHHRINRTDKFVRRIFNNGSWDQGGRFYGAWWQRVPGKRKSGVAWRAGIQINGNRTGELDYSGLHIVLLYLLKGVDYWSVDGRDPYEVDGLENTAEMRNLLKVILLSSINAKSLEATRASVQSQINFNPEEYGWVKEEDIKIMDVIHAFRERHPLIKEEFSSGAGTKLMNLDSKIADMVINHFTGKNIPILCIHDSFVIEVHHGQELKEVMNAAIKHQFPDVEVTSKTKGWEADFTWNEGLPNDNDVLVSETAENGYEDPDWKDRRRRFLARSYEEVFFM